MANSEPVTRSTGQAYRPYRPSFRVIASALVLSTVLGLGWWVRDEQYLRPEDGAGYALGILGSSLMLALLAYSARKRLRSWSRLGALSSWFRIHMILGVLGPIAILFHANFDVESSNATIALAATLLVSGSGLIGRFIYGQVHWGLYGRRASLQELRKELTEAEGVARPVLSVFPEVLVELDAFEVRFVEPPRSALGALGRLALLGGRQRGLRRRVADQIGPVFADARAAGELYVDGLAKVAAFACYERLFRLWHALHVPLFVVLILAVVVHVVAVHMY